MRVRFKFEVAGPETVRATFDGAALAFEGDRASITAAGDQPHLLRVEGEGPPGTSVEVFISSSVGDDWLLVKEIGADGRFSLVQELVPEARRGWDEDSDDSDDLDDWPGVRGGGDDWPGPAGGEPMTEPIPPVSPEAREKAKERIYGDLDFATDRLSTQVRSLSFGILAIVWALMVKGEGMERLHWSPRLLLLLAGLSILTMLVDFLQYVAAYRASMRAKHDLDAGGPGKYRRSWPSARLRDWCFRAKIVLCLAATTIFLVAVIATVSPADRPGAKPAATADSAKA